MFKKILSVVFISCIPWILWATLIIDNNSDEIILIRASIVELKTRYAFLDTKLTELILKQDERITLLEGIIERSNRDVKG